MCDELQTMATCTEEGVMVKEITLQKWLTTYNIIIVVLNIEASVTATKKSSEPFGFIYIYIYI